LMPRQRILGDDSTYRWNEIAGRYINQSGNFVSFADVRSYLDEVLDRHERKIMSLSSALREGSINVQQWQAGMKDALKDLHLVSGALARGGWAQMSQADYGRVGNQLRFQYERLAKFAQQIERGLPFDGRFIRRTQLYAQSGRVSYTAALRQEMALRGYTEEQSVLAAADHCSECVAEADKGWVKIGTLINIGERICKSNCRCHLEFREG
jgi:hypothetical protein